VLKLEKGSKGDNASKDGGAESKMSAAENTLGFEMPEGSIDRVPENLKILRRVSGYDLEFEDGRLTFDFKVMNIPAAAVLCISLWEGKGHLKPRGWAGMRLFGYNRVMLSGMHTLKLVPYTVSVNPCSTTIDGSRIRTGLVSSLEVTIDETLPSNIRYNDDLPIEDIKLQGTTDQPNSRYVESDEDEESMGHGPERYQGDMKPTMSEFYVHKSRLASIARKDPLYKLTEEDKSLLWRFREHCMDNDTVLPKLLRSIDWGNRNMVQEGYRVMYAWEQPRPIIALAMLNDHFPDPKVCTVYVFSSILFK